MPTSIEAVRRTLEAYVNACNAGDANAYAATLMPDVVICPPGQAPIEGSDAARTWVKEGFFDAFNVTFAASFDRVITTDTEVMAPGTFSLVLTPKAGGDSIELTGTFFNIFREDSPGSWKYSWLVWNFQQPFG